MIEVKKFEAEWCGPCKMLKPVFESLKTKVDNDVRISYIDVDENQDVAVKYGVRSVPTVVIERDGTEVSRIVGARSEVQYLNEISSAKQ